MPPFPQHPESNLCRSRWRDTVAQRRLTDRDYSCFQVVGHAAPHQPKFFDKFLAINYSQEANLRFAEMPEILPGWSLRFKRARRWPGIRRAIARPD